MQGAGGVRPPAWIGRTANYHGKGNSAQPWDRSLKHPGYHWETMQIRNGRLRTDVA